MGRGQRQASSTRQGTDPARTTAATAQAERVRGVDAALEAVGVLCSYLEQTDDKRRTEEQRQELVGHKIVATTLVSALDPEGQALLHDCAADIRRSGEWNRPIEIKEILNFIRTNNIRREMRYAYIEGRVEARLRLDRMLLGPQALHDQRVLYSLTFALGQEGATPSRVRGIGITYAAETRVTDGFGALRACDLAQAYQSGLAIAGLLQYENSRSTRRFGEHDHAVERIASELPTRQCFGNLIVL